MYLFQNVYVYINIWDSRIDLDTITTYLQVPPQVIVFLVFICEEYSDHFYDVFHKRNMFGEKFHKWNHIMKISMACAATDTL